MTRAARVAYWLAPMAFCLAVYWVGTKIWFAEDDFAWLNLRSHVTDFHQFLWAMFAPLAQGTIRPLSERGFFMLFSYFFGLHARPYRIFVFLNQFLNIVLLMLVTRKLTKSALAGFVAPVLWLANIALVIPMAWTAAYNEVQCTTFVLSSFYLFLRYTETGERKFYWAQCVTFVLGFGALEINAFYPAIAGLYAILFARRYVVSTLPLFVVSGAFAVAHRLAGSTGPDYYYDMDFHVHALWNTLIQYWKILLGVPAFITTEHWPQPIGGAAVLLFTAASLAFVAWQAWKRQLLPLFFLGWFFIILSLLLPLHNHVTDYYLFVPSIGTAMLGAHAMSLAWTRGWIWRTLTAALLIIYVVPSAITSHQRMFWYFDRAERARTLVRSVVYAKRIHPGKAILLRNVDDDLFWTVVYDSPFRILGWSDIFVTPDSRQKIHNDPHFGSIEGYFLPESAVSRALKDGTAVVYSVGKLQLRNTTQAYTAFFNSQPDPELAPNIDVGASYSKDQVGDGWYGLENGFRWSTKHAVIYLLGPTAPGQKLTLHGNAPSQQVEHGPLHFALTIDGRPQPVMTIDHSNTEFHFAYDLPADLIGRPKIEIAFTLDRTIRVPTDDRDFGLAFGEFAIR